MEQQFFVGGGGGVSERLCNGSQAVWNWRRRTGCGIEGGSSLKREKLPFALFTNLFISLGELYIEAD